jgi:hypothetical protein
VQSARFLFSIVNYCPTRNKEKARKTIAFRLRHPMAATVPVLSNQNKKSPIGAFFVLNYNAFFDTKVSWCKFCTSRSFWCITNGYGAFWDLTIFFVVI